MNKDGFNIDDYLNDPEFENKLENYREKMILEAIEHNYQNIVKNGLSAWQSTRNDSNRANWAKRNTHLYDKTLH